MENPDGMPTSVVRVGGTVRRPGGPATPTLLALLGHLEAVGFSGSPRVVGDGYDAEGRMVVTYLEGESVHPHAWSDDGIWHVGRLLRDLHDATATFRPPADAVWPHWFFRSSGPAAIIGHGDTGPWNILARHGRLVAFIDWEFAGPIDRLDEIAATGWWNAQLHDDDVAARNGLPDAGARAAQLRHFLDGYGLPAAERSGLVTRMVEYAIRDCAKEAIEPMTSGSEPPEPITPESTDPAPLWALAWRARSAAWLLRHRPLLERAIGG
jgi:hypothetical protein